MVVIMSLLVLLSSSIGKSGDIVLFMSFAPSIHVQVLSLVDKLSLTLFISRELSRPNW